MPKFSVLNRDKLSSFVEIQEGQSLMECLRNAGYDELIAICGGNCSCATCHVYLRDIDLETLPKKSEDEEALLEGLQYFSNDSRLSCQIQVNHLLDGATVVIPPEE